MSGMLLLTALFELYPGKQFFCQRLQALTFPNSKKCFSVPFHTVVPAHSGDLDLVVRDQMDEK